MALVRYAAGFDGELWIEVEDTGLDPSEVTDAAWSQAEAALEEITRGRHELFLGAPLYVERL